VQRGGIAGLYCLYDVHIAVSGGHVTSYGDAYNLSYFDIVADGAIASRPYSIF